MSLETENSSVEQTSTDASTESSSETQESSSAERNEGARSTERENVPFHEHPRFKEIINDRNQFAEQLKAAQKQLQEYGERFKSLDTSKAQQAGEQRNALINRLKGIDPEFGSYFEQLAARADKVEQLEKTVQDMSQWREQSTTQSASQQVKSEIDRLHTENKVPKEYQDLYRLKIKEIANANPKLGPQDLPNVYAQVHKEMGKLFEARDRQTRESYVNGKKQDSKVPTNRRGEAPKQGSKFEYSKDPYEARQQLVQRIVNASRESKNS